MCLVVYLAASRPLPLIPWEEARPAFHVTEVPEDRMGVRNQFTQYHLYYTGSHEMCGCGFQYGESDVDQADPVDIAKEKQNKESRTRLAEYLREALKVVPVVELYACWDGDEELPREHSSCIRPEELITSRPFFLEREYLRVDAG